MTQCSYILWLFLRNWSLDRYTFRVSSAHRSSRRWKLGLWLIRLHIRWLGLLVLRSPTADSVRFRGTLRQIWLIKCWILYWFSFFVNWSIWTRSWSRNTFALAGSTLTIWSGSSFNDGTADFGLVSQVSVQYLIVYFSEDVKPFWKSEITSEVILKITCWDRVVGESILHSLMVEHIHLLLVISDLAYLWSKLCSLSKLSFARDSAHISGLQIFTTQERWILQFGVIVPCKAINIWVHHMIVKVLTLFADNILHWLMVHLVLINLTFLQVRLSLSDKLPWLISFVPPRTFRALLGTCVHVLNIALKLDISTGVQVITLTVNWWIHLEIQWGCLALIKKVAAITCDDVLATLRCMVIHYWWLCCRVLCSNIAKLREGTVGVWRSDVIKETLGNRNARFGSIFE